MAGRSATWSLLLWLSSVVSFHYDHNARAIALVVSARGSSVSNGAVFKGGLRRWHLPLTPPPRPWPLSHPRMSADDVTPTNGLTTRASSGEMQRNGSPGGTLHDPDLFIPAPSLAENAADSAAALTSSTFFGAIMDGTEGKEPDLRCFKPLERVVLTSNGNLQRLISSYYDAVVTVNVKRCEEVQPSVHEREVTLTVLGREFCVAKSVVVLHSSICRETFKKGDLGLGQMFRAFDILPRFELLRAGRKATEASGGSGGKVQGSEAMSVPPLEGGNLWRLYDLKSRHLSCRIHEEFATDLFELADG